MADSKPSQQRPRLGRGLSSLIINSTATDPSTEAQAYQSTEPVPADQAGKQPIPLKEVAGKAQEIGIDDISPNPYQPRRQFGAEELSELSASISQQGILQPLIVAKAIRGDRPYILIAGERRLRAARQTGLATVPCIIKQASPQQMLEWALVENIQRTDLNPIEKAEAYRDYIDRFNLTQAQAAERLGQPRPTVANYLRLLELQDEIRQMIVSGALTFGHAKLLASIMANPSRQLTLARKVVSKNLSVRQLEGLIEAIQNMLSGSQPTKSTRRAKPPYILDLEERLTRRLGTRVSIHPGRAKNTGKIVVDYYSLEEFDRISAALGLAESDS